MNKFKNEDDEAIEGDEDEKQEEQKQEEQKTVEQTETKEELVIKSDTEKKEEETNKSKIKSGYKTQSEIQLPKEDAFDFKEPVKSYFKKIQIVQDKSKFSQKELHNYGGSYGMFYCEKKFGEELYCDQASLMSCPNCMKLNQRMYGLKPHYLINDKGRVCTFKRNQIYCNGRFLKEDDQNGIIYSYNYVCGHSGQCDACKKLSKHYALYFDKNLLEKLRKRDELLVK